MASLHEDHIAGCGALREFLGESPRELLAASLKSSVWEPGIRSALTTYHQSRGGEVLRKPPGEGLAVVTGQQPGLLTGPLYTIHKAATAIQLARTIETRTGISCTPVFWVADDDHDFEEVRHVHILDKQDAPLLLNYEPETAPTDRPIARIPAETSLHELVDEAARVSRGGELQEAVTALLHDTLDKAESFADWFARLLARLFRGTPLLVFSPRLPEARQKAADILKAEIAQPLATTAAVMERGKRLEQLGYTAQLQKAPNECAFFVEEDGLRRKVIYASGAFTLAETGQQITGETMSRMLRDQPERFSPNAALRPVTQQALFPAAAYVAGPGEVAYWAQLKPVFERHELPMPVVYPRASFALVYEKHQQLLERHGLTPDDLQRPTEQLVEQALRRHPPDSAMLPLLNTYRERVCEELERFARDFEARDATAGAMAESMREHAERQFQRMERVLLKSDRDHHETVQNQVKRLRNVLYPGGVPQERYYTVFSFLFEQGPVLIERITGAVEPGHFEKKEIVL
ncbi:MAG: bacillithiol biosynthesis cysteine-adding enzyme BshC [Candidatus Hydrogenedentota bacterium]